MEFESNHTTNSEQAQGTQGIECRTCGCRHLPVDCTRQRGNSVIRYRVCRHCGTRTTTRETVVK